MDYIGSALFMALLSLLWTFPYVQARDVTVEVTESVCGKLHYLLNEDSVVLIYNNVKLLSNQDCDITVSARDVSSELCISFDDYSVVNYPCSLVLDLYGGYKYGDNIHCYAYAKCVPHYRVIAKFTYLERYPKFTVKVKFYIEQKHVTTTHKITTPYVYESPKGEYHPGTSVAMIVAIPVGVCACTCFLILCILCCGKNNDNNTPTPAPTRNNDELHEMNNQPMIAPSAPELPINRTTLWRGVTTTENNFSDEPPDYNQVMSNSPPHDPDKDDPDRIPDEPPPPYPGV